LLFVVLLSTMMLPSILTLIPTHVLFARLGLVNAYWPWPLWGLAASPPWPPRRTWCSSSGGSSRLYRRTSRTRPSSTAAGRAHPLAHLPAPVPAGAAHLPAHHARGGHHPGLPEPAYGDYLPTLQAAAALLYVVPIMLVFLFAQRYFVRSVAASGMSG
jgi:multiple sugar transport system permease protein